ncbi:MAG: hypothetical protein AAGA66_11615 [Bacteroidota bacterium]
MMKVLKKGATKESIKKVSKEISERPSKKGFNAQEFCGLLKLDEDALVIQKRMRDEWD